MKAAEMFSLKGRVALVTGASSGLGQQFARALADNGAAVALVARRVERLGELQKSIEAAGGRAVAIEADVTDRAAMARAFDAAEKAFGTVTILVNNAGIAHSGRAVDMPPEEWRKALAVELAFKGIRVNAIAPGWFVTEINDSYLESEAGAAIKRDIPMGRFGNEGELDGALLLLTSDAGAYITGATILVDGGQVVQIKG